jgi:cytidine deaminase
MMRGRRRRRPAQIVMRMHHKEFHTRFLILDSAKELSPADASLLASARAATGQSYSPYSRFKVGAAARMVSGALVQGSNQENASYPAGICAERTLLSVASTLYPGEPIDTLAITYQGEGPSDEPITPCGICRQSLSEFQARTGKAMRLILSGANGPVWVFEDAGALLPLAFGAGDL